MIFFLSHGLLSLGSSLCTEVLKNIYMDSVESNINACVNNSLIFAFYVIRLDETS